MKTIAAQTLANIVTNNHSTVPVLEKYHLDFCCKGKRTLADACNEKGLDVETIAAELEKSTEVQSNKMPFTEMNAEQLISYILIHHHLRKAIHANHTRAFGKSSSKTWRPFSKYG